MFWGKKALGNGLFIDLTEWRTSAHQSLQYQGCVYLINRRVFLPIEALTSSNVKYSQKENQGLQSENPFQSEINIRYDLNSL